MNPTKSSKGITSGTKLAIGLVLGGALLGLIALKYRQLQPNPSTTQPTQQVKQA